jgi:hypothetical protein
MAITHKLLFSHWLEELFDHFICRVKRLAGIFFVFIIDDEAFFALLNDDAIGVWLFGSSMDCVGIRKDISAVGCDTNE